MASLDLAYALVNRKRHSVPRDDWVEDDIGVGELLVHVVQRFHELICEGEGQDVKVGSMTLTR